MHPYLLDCDEEILKLALACVLEPGLSSRVKSGGHIVVFAAEHSPELAAQLRHLARYDWDKTAAVLAWDEHKCRS